jgi:hypothetical protein
MDQSQILKQKIEKINEKLHLLLEEDVCDGVEKEELMTNIGFLSACEMFKVYNLIENVDELVKQLEEIEVFSNSFEGFGKEE